jgi:hypothetical protein
VATGLPAVVELLRVSALLEGIRRVNRAPAILGGVWLLTFALTLPLGLAMRSLIKQHLGSSLAADTAASGVNYDWMQEFGDQATGLGATLKPTVIGAGAVLDNLSSFIDYVHRPLVIVGAAGAYLALWLFVAGGVIDRYARERPTRAHGFFAASGVFFFRFLRLAAVMWIVYGFLFGYVHPWLFDDFYPRITRDLSVERTAFLVRVALYAVFGVALGACNLIFDYAKVRAVVEDRRSMLAAIGAAVRFAAVHGRAAASLYAADFILFLVVVALYAAAAPGAGGAGLSMWLAFTVGQLYVLARLWVKLVFWASEVALFQSRLAHAGYVARPLPRWPESPAAEAISH